MKANILVIAAGALALAACSGQKKEEAPAAPAAPVATKVQAPSAEYALDKTHASLVFRVNHMGLSNYTMRFTDFDATITFNAAEPAKSSVTATINPLSLRTDYPGDFKATHPGAKFKSWDEELTKAEEWLNATKFPQITFKSTGVTLTGANAGTMTGDLTILGVTKPVTLDVTFNGERVPHPFFPNQAAIGFSADGAFNRSDFGLKALIPADPNAPGVADAVSVHIEGEFLQKVAAAAPAAPAPAPAKAK